MNERDKAALTERCKGFSKEEQQLVAQNLPNEIIVEELMRRLENLDSITRHLNNLATTFKGEMIHVE